MKTFRLIMAGLLFVVTGQMKAQVSVNVNIGSPPAWGPSGYTDVRYYYIPDIGIYYDVANAEYIYPNNNVWVRTTVVPVAYRQYNFYNGYKVVLTDYKGATPYVYYKKHKVKYPKGYHPSRQKTIGIPPGQAKKARVVTTPRGNAIVVQKGNNGRGNGEGHGNGKGKH
ncbi:hypothetical protein ACLI09_15115 [Flavobacterium sp. RHBU_24]|uniref:hypothetical protein n=1 Tax=Flavobacterium sp. RHBU_24 TaxID=3391185 RepID=UPI00398529CA